MLALKSCQFLVRSSTQVARLNSCFYHHLTLKPLCGKDIRRIGVFINQLTQRKHLNKDINRDFKPLYDLDKVDKHCELIYNYDMSFYYYSMIFHAMALPAFMLGLYSVVKDITTVQTMAEVKWMRPVNGSLMLAIAIYMNQLMRKFIIRIYYNPKTDSYSAVYSGWNFTLEKLEFKTEHCYVAYDDSKIKLPGGNIHIKGQGFSLHHNRFKYPSNYEKMLGYNSENTNKQLKK